MEEKRGDKETKGGVSKAGIGQRRVEGQGRHTEQLPCRQSNPLLSKVH